MQKLTKKRIDRTRTDAGDLVLWDPALPGFGLRVKKSGVKSFLIQYRNRHGRSRRYTIGRYGIVTLDEARSLARQLLSGAKRGMDPVRDRRDAWSCETVDQLAEKYMTDHCEGRCKESTMAAHRWLLSKFIIPDLGKYAVSEVQLADIERLHQSLKATPYNANRVLGLLKTMFRHAERWRMRAPNTNPTWDIEKFKEKRRQRYLSIEELRRLADVLEYAERTGDISLHVGAAFRLLILTGARLNEIRTLRWDHIDSFRRLIVLKEHKSDAHGMKSIPLNEPAMRVLRQIPRILGNPYVIAGLKPGQPVVNLQKPWRRIRSRAGLSDVRIHDLRHSFASFGINAGTSLPLIGGLLGHRSVAATAAYAHLAVDPLRQACDVVGDIVGSQLFNESEGNRKLLNGPRRLPHATN